jgi:hypothetical protein
MYFDGTLPVCSGMFILDMNTIHISTRHIAAVNERRES